MPDFQTSPISIVNQIKRNLQDRYDSGYPILKELLQNADDAGAQRFRLDALPGWPTATNPLLQGPGLLVINDGVFREEDQRGIISFGESDKATDNAAIGKFGLGQKAVFHLCDAFIVCAYSDSKSFSTVVNPFLGVEVDGNVSRQWEPPDGDGLAKTDLNVLQAEIPADFPNRGLALWLPFRRRGLIPAPGVSFSSNLPSAPHTIAELCRLGDLCVLLTMLRHLESIDIRERGRAMSYDRYYLIGGRPRPYEASMSWSLNIGKVAGTVVRVHLTFLLFLAWIFAASYASGGAATAWNSLAFMVLLFLCVLLHEFGHIFTARAFGVPTPYVTLLPIGGVAQLERIP
jgi:hypothetical protein